MLNITHLRCVACTLVVMTTPSKTPIPVLLDCDTGIDDSLAVIYLASLHLAGDIEIKGVTTTAGNVGSTETAVNTRYILNLCGLEDIPVAEGETKPLKVVLETIPEIHGPKGLGYVIPPEGLHDTLDPRPWEQLWKDILTQNPETHVIVTGPATNLAKYIRNNEKPQRVSLMGGAYNYPGNTTPVAEWNSWCDPHAAKEIFNANLNIMVCALEMTEQYTIDPDELATLVANVEGTKIAETLNEVMRFYFEFHQGVGIGNKAQIHDLLACMLAMDKVPHETITVAIDVEADSELTRGQTIVDLKNRWGREQTAHLVTNVDFDKAHAEFARALKELKQHL